METLLLGHASYIYVRVKSSNVAFESTLENRLFQKTAETFFRKGVCTLENTAAQLDHRVISYNDIFMNDARFTMTDEKTFLIYRTCIVIG